MEDQIGHETTKLGMVAHDHGRKWKANPETIWGIVMMLTMADFKSIESYLLVNCCIS